MKLTDYVSLCDRMVGVIRARQDSPDGPPSVRRLAKTLKVRQSDVIQMCEDRCLCVNVADGIQGVGYRSMDRIGDYTVEDLSVSMVQH